MAPPEAFLEFYARDAETVLVFFTRRTLDAEIALDLTAETFAQAWRAWAKVRTDSTEEVHGWLFTIARRQLARYWRRGEVERRALRSVGVPVPTVDDGDISEIERAADLPGLRAALGPELAKLTDNAREALQLRIVEELPYDTVARRLGTSESTARARVSRALRTLAAALEPVYENGGLM